MLSHLIVTGNRVWADERDRVELQIGNIAVRLGTRTLLTLANLDNRAVQMNFQDHIINLRVRRLNCNQVVEVDTPNSAFVARQEGEYRITVDATHNSTEAHTHNNRPRCPAKTPTTS